MIYKHLSPWIVNNCTVFCPLNVNSVIHIHVLHIFINSVIQTICIDRGMACTGVNSMDMMILMLFVTITLCTET